MFEIQRVFLCFFFIIFFQSCAFQNLKKSTVKVSSGKIKRIKNFPSKFTSSRNIDIWLPDRYNARKHYPVLYMHDGQMLFDAASTWNNQEWGVDEIIKDLVNEKVIKECIVVGIWNSGDYRGNDYFPQKPFKNLSQMHQDSIIQVLKDNNQRTSFLRDLRSDNYLKFIVQELKPFIDENYSTLKEKENTFMAGSSMGGLISIYAICEYPEVFGGAACLSTHWIGVFTNLNNPIPSILETYLKTHLPSPNDHKIYFDYGTETLDAMYEPYQVRVDSLMSQRGFRARTWKTLKFQGEPHTENAWKKRFHIPLTFFLKKNNVKE